jgi:hypothetical protein
MGSTQTSSRHDHLEDNTPADRRKFAGRPGG